MANVEPLHNGLVTSRDASLLEPGELTLAEDVTLKPGSKSVHKAPGRTRFNSTPLPSGVQGITYADFDTAADKLVVVSDGSYYTANAGEIGTFTVLTTGAGTTLDSVSVEDKTVLVSGAGRNIVLLNDGTFRPQGLEPVTQAPGAQHFASGGTWPLGENSINKYYDYWSTEVVKTALDEVESGFEGTPATVLVTATISHVTITAPDIVNPSATHWRVYRSDGKTNSTDVAFPHGFLIADIPITTRTFEDGVVQTAALALPTTAVAWMTIPFPTDEQYIQQSVLPWLNPTNALLDDGNLAASPVLGRVGFDPQVMTLSMLVVGGFGFTNIGDPITEIHVEVEGSKTADCFAGVSLSWDGGSTFTNFIALPLTTSTSVVTIKNLFNRTWSGSDFSNANFKLMIQATSALNGLAQCFIDYIKVAVTHSGTTASESDLFPFLSLQVGGQQTPIGSHGKPPTSTTADLFQGSILMNDVDNPAEVAWTIPGTIDYSPSLYRLRLNDVVKCIRTLGSSAIIGCKDTCTRMNFLPVAEDPEFNTGRAQDVFDSDGGIVSNKAAARFVLGGQQLLFYVSNAALKITNGFTTDSATDDIIWTDLANTGLLHQCFVENNPINYEILVYFPAKAGGFKCLRLSYHSSHLKNGKLKVAGITNYDPQCATRGTITTEQMLFTAKGGHVYVENRGFSDHSGGTIVPTIRTREMHLNGLGGGWELPRFAIHHQGGGGTITSFLTAVLANYSAVDTDQQTNDLEFRTLSHIANAAAGDGISITLIGSDGGVPVTLDYLVLYPIGHSDSYPLKQ